MGLRIGGLIGDDGVLAKALLETTARSHRLNWRRLPARYSDSTGNPHRRTFGASLGRIIRSSPCNTVLSTESENLDSRLTVEANHDFKVTDWCKSVKLISSKLVFLRNNTSRAQLTSA